MSVIFTVLIVIVSALLILVVMIQNPKGGGLSSGFSSANQIGGVRKTTDFLEKATWTLAIGVVVLSLFSALILPNNKTTGPINTEATEMLQEMSAATQNAAQQGGSAEDLGQ